MEQTTIHSLQNRNVDSQGSLSLFMSLCNELSLIGSTHGIPLVAYNDRGLSNFLSLGSDQQIQIIDALRVYVQQLQSASYKKIPITGDNRVHAWWSLSRLGLIPPDDLFDQISTNDFIEIYDENSIQVFRSFELFRHLSYSLSEIFTFTWVDLFERDSFVFKRMFDMVQDVLSGKITSLIKPQFPSHVVSEKFSSQLYWVKMQHKIICPLKKTDGSIGGLLSAFEVVDFGHKS